MPVRFYSAVELLHGLYNVLHMNQKTREEGDGICKRKTLEAAVLLRNRKGGQCSVGEERSYKIHSKRKWRVKRNLCAKDAH